MSSKTNSRFLTSSAISRIALGEAVEDVLLRFAVDEAHELRERLDAAGLREVGAGDQQPAAEQLVELLEHFGSGLLEDRDAHRDVGLQFGLELREHDAGLFGRHVDEDQGDRLRMLFADELEQLRPARSS